MYIYKIFKWYENDIFGCGLWLITNDDGKRRSQGLLIKQGKKKKSHSKNYRHTAKEIRRRSLYSIYFRCLFVLFIVDFFSFGSALSLCFPFCLQFLAYSIHDCYSLLFRFLDKDKKNTTRYHEFKEDPILPITRR